MDLSTLGSSLQQSLGAHLPSIAAGLAILILGWIVAVVARAGVRRGLGLLKLNAHIQQSTESKMDAESAIASGLFWLILLITLIGVFNALDLPLLSDPFRIMVGQIVAYVPRLIAGTVLILVAWIAATLLRSLSNKVLAATQLDDKLSEHAGMQPMSKSVGNVLFWLVILLFTPAILGAYDLGGLLEPVKEMITKTLDLLPNIFAATVIGLVGWLVGRILGRLVSNILAAAGADKAVARVGLDESIRVSRLAGTLVLIFVFVPSLIAALDTLRIDAISEPAIRMLDRMMAAIPNLVAAGLILIITFYVARFAAGVLTRISNSVGLDALPEKMGLEHVFSGVVQPSRLAGALVMFFAMLFAAVEAANQLDFTQVRDVVTMFIEFGADVLLGGAILVIGFWLANVAYDAIVRLSGENTPALARIARVAIIGLVLAMGLRAMGIADDIVNLAFAFTFGAVAVAVALSFGLGGREAAGRQMEHWFARLRKQA
jgi:hypothetical protein